MTGIPERRVRVEGYPIPSPSKTVLVGKIKDRVSTEAELAITDEYKAYETAANDYRHAVVNHIREWARRNVHTEMIENLRSLLKRGVMGCFRRVSVNQLARYLAGFTCRFSRREEANLFLVTLGGLSCTMILPYEELIAESVK